MTVRSLRETRRAGCAVAAGVLLANASAETAPPPQVHAYLPFFVSYARHAETLWHEHGSGGYWGDGLAGGNGGIRGTSNLTLAFAMLVHASDAGWLSAEQRKQLAELGLGRTACLERIRQSWRYLAQSHATGDGASATDKKQWGRSWQSSLWVGASGLAALLVWEDLDEETRALVERVVVDEANQKIAAKPRDASPGNTAAEENGWDTQAPAIAVALFPQHENAGKWLRAAQVLAANTYSVRADHTSEALLGEERVRDAVTTTNLFADFTLDNHGFFHPSYLKVSGQELGESLAMLGLGDQRHGTAFAGRFRPYGLHHVADAWQIMKHLLLPEGEYAYPSGSDWAVHLPSHQSYYAFIATVLRDPVAALAERRGLTPARTRRRASTGGRFLGATNFEWWWEPIALKRFSLAMLQFVLCPEAPEPAPDGALHDYTETWLSEPTQILVHRTPRYFASVSMRKRPTGLFIPLGDRHMDHPYVVTPRVGGLLPAGSIEDYSRHDHERGTALLMHSANGGGAAVVALRSVMLWVATDRLGGIGIQNDNVVTGTGRTLRWAGATRHVPPLKPVDPFEIQSRWLDIDGQLGLLTETGFRYAPAGKYTRRSAAEDVVTATPGDSGVCLLTVPRCEAGALASLAEQFTAKREGARRRVRCRDGIGGPLVEISVDLRGTVWLSAPTDLKVIGSAHEKFLLDRMVDGDPTTYTVLRNDRGTGPTPEAPVALEFGLPAETDTPAALRLTPRPRYGPRAVRLQVLRGGQWRESATAELASEPRDLQLGVNGPAERYRLTVTRGWDRGEELADAPRNTQIAELAFVLPASAEPPRSDDRSPFELSVLDRTEGK